MENLKEFRGILETSAQERVIVCLRPSVSSNNEKIGHKISEGKITGCEKTTGVQSGDFSDLNSAFIKYQFP